MQLDWSARMKQVRVQQGKDGVWFCRPYLGVNAVTGKPMRPYRRFPKAKDEADARAMAQDWVNTLAVAADMHVSMRLVDTLYAYVDYLEGLNKPANTIKTYRSSVRAYIEPNVGNIAVDEVRPYVIDALYSVVMARGGKFGKPVSPNTVIKLHWFLRGAFRYFAANGTYTAITQTLQKYSYPEIDENQRIATGVIVTNGIGTSYWVAGVVKLEPDCSEYECYLYLSSVVGTSNPGEMIKMKSGDACPYDKATSPFKCECY